MPKGTPGRLPCSVNGCTATASGWGMCGMHYMRTKNRGTTDPRRLPTEQERFLRNVEKSPDCWLWTASRRSAGYGQFSPSHTRNVLAHRYSYELHVGPIPPGLTLDHLCRNPPCVRPDHLEPVTQRENTLRGTTRPAQNAVKTECLRGHPFDATNTYTDTRGCRQCRICRRDATRRYQLRQKE